MWIRCSLAVSIEDVGGGVDLETSSYADRCAICEMLVIFNVSLMINSPILISRDPPGGGRESASRVLTRNPQNVLPDNASTKETSRAIPHDVLGCGNTGFLDGASCSSITGMQDKISGA